MQLTQAKRRRGDLLTAAAVAALLAVMPQTFVWLSAAFGLTMDLKRPNLTWTNEITVIKQRLTVLLAMLGGWVYAAVIGLLYLLVLPGWSMGSYISQSQLASLLGVELSAVELQDMTSLSLTLGALQKVSPAGALDGYTYYQLPAGESGLSCIVGLPLKTLFAKETPLHSLLTIPEHEVTIALNGTVTAAETAVVAPSSRMTDADVQRFVELRKALESFTDVLQSLLS